MTAALAWPEPVAAAREGRRIPLRGLVFTILGLVSLTLCTGVATALVLNARKAVEEETASAFTLSQAAILQRLGRAASATGTMDQAVRLADEIDARRHVAVALLDTHGNILEHRGAGTTAPETAPRWFAALLATPRLEDRFPVTHYPNVLGVLRLTTDPGDEIAEVWEDFRIILPMLALTSFGIVLLSLALAHVLAGRLRSMRDAMAAMQAGNLGVRAPRDRLSELADLADGVNALASHLQSERAENARLQERLLTLSEAERARIASDLHDEMGPQLFALSAAAGEVRQALASGSAAGAALSDAVDAILRHTAAIQKSARTAINDLRPMVAGEATLAELLGELIDEFRDSAPDTRFRLSADTDVVSSEMGELSIYRFVRESVLNSLRHGKARNIDVDLHRDGEAIAVRVTDSGSGPPGDAAAPSFGQLGMQDRARALGAIYRPPYRDGNRTVTDLRMPMP